MSRIAKIPILVPNNVQCTINETYIFLTGPMGSLTQSLISTVQVLYKNRKILCIPYKEHNWKYAGTMRAIINNMILGVHTGYEITLELIGIGYKAHLNTNNVLILSVGFSHIVQYTVPREIQVEIRNNTIILLKGINKQIIGEVAAQIRSIKPPEPYKGKGIRYSHEVIILKESKKK